MAFPRSSVGTITEALERGNDYKNDYNLNISRYVSTAKPEPEIDLAAVHAQLRDIEKRISESARTHNQYLKELGLPPV
jgi:type I restriction enzyme M protein